VVHASFSDDKRCHSSEGFETPPAKRQAIPIMAIGSGGDIIADGMAFCWRDVDVDIAFKKHDYSDTCPLRVRSLARLYNQILSVKSGCDRKLGDGNGSQTNSDSSLSIDPSHGTFTFRLPV
jgi:hypothetical protein